MTNYNFVNEIQINQYFINEVNRKSHTFYRIYITTSNKTYTVEKRFSEFETLHNELKKKISKSIHFVEFPSSHLYTRTHKTFENRMKTLDNYINKLVAFFNHDFPRELVTFLKLDELTINESPNYQVNNESQEIEDNDDSNVTQKMPMLGLSEATLNDIIRTYSSKMKSNLETG